MEHKIFSMPFAKVYDCYIQKVEKKDRTKAELDEVLCWLTGFTPAELKKHIQNEIDFTTFFKNAQLHPSTNKITGVVCGVRVEDVEDPLMRKIRYMDKLVDELAKGKTMEYILRS